MNGWDGSAKDRLVVLISGCGSNLQAVLDACDRDEIAAEVTAVVSNKREAFGLQRARCAGVPAIYHPKFKAIDRREYDASLAEVVAGFHPDWVLLLGWMRMLSSAFLDCFQGRVINLHPALPGQFPGDCAIWEAYEAYQDGRIEHTGVMVHLVPDEAMDSGPVLGSENVPIFPGDTLAALEARMHAVEHRLVIDVLKRLPVMAPQTA